MPVVVVIDTSVWVSAFLNPAGYPARLITLGKMGRFVVISSKPLMEELHEVLLRPRIMKLRHTLPPRRVTSETSRGWKREKARRKMEDDLRRRFPSFIFALPSSSDLWALRDISFKPEQCLTSPSASKTAS